MTREEQIKTLEDVRDCLLAIAEGRLPARSVSFAGLAHDVELVRKCLEDEGEAPARETLDWRQAIGASPLQEGMSTASEAIRQEREEGR